MIAKIVKGASFRGCVQYVTGKDEAKILASDGVLLGSVGNIADSFEYQRGLNPRCSKPVGHIALSFKPEDKEKLTEQREQSQTSLGSAESRRKKAEGQLTDEMMAKIAREYMELMGIKDTQFILVRHHNTANPHCHLVYNRVDNNCKIISDKFERKRSEKIVKHLKDKYGLTYSDGKESPVLHLTSRHWDCSIQTIPSMTLPRKSSCSGKRLRRLPPTDATKEKETWAEAISETNNKSIHNKQKSKKT